MVFDKQYFKNNQNILLFLCNNWILKYWFRYVLRIHKDLKFSEKIIELMPNNYKVKIGNSIRADFRTHNKFSKRLYFAFKPYWHFRHSLDTFIKSFIPFEIEFAYDTLTAYSQTGGGGANVTCDGWAEQTYATGSGQSWSTIRGAAGNGNNTTGTTLNIQIVADTTTNNYTYLRRCVATYDTSSIGTGQTISSAVLSLMGNAKGTALDASLDLAIVTANLAALNTVANGDYDSFGTSAISNTIAYADIQLASYNDFTLTATGIAQINMTGVSQLGIRNMNFDASNNTPTWSSGGNTYITIRSADYSGTSSDPKLVVTYSATPPSTATNKIAGIL